MLNLPTGHLRERDRRAAPAAPRGFTLIEIVTTLVIMSLLGTVVLVGSMVYFARHKQQVRDSFVKSLVDSAAVASAKKEPERGFAPFSYAALRADSHGTVSLAAAKSAFEAGLPSEAKVTKYFEYDGKSTPSTADDVLYLLDNPKDAAQAKTHVDRVEVQARVAGEDVTLCVRLPQAGSAAPQEFTGSYSVPGLPQGTYVRSDCGAAAVRNVRDCHLTDDCASQQPVLTWSVLNRDPAHSRGTARLSWTETGASSYSLFKVRTGTGATRTLLTGPLADDGGVSLTFDDTLPMGQQWDYVVVASYPAGFADPIVSSNTVTVQIDPAVAPSAPHLTHVWTDQVSNPVTANLTWARAEGVLTYLVQEKNGNTWTDASVALTGAGTGDVVYPVTLPKGSTKTYRVVATFDDRFFPETATSNEDVLASDCIPPATPVVSITEGYDMLGAPVATVSWPAVAGASYTVRRARVSYAGSPLTATVGGWTDVTSPITTTAGTASLVDTQVNLGESWTYQVQGSVVSNGSPCPGGVGTAGAAVDFRPATPTLAGSLAVNATKTGADVSVSWASVSTAGTYQVFDSANHLLTTTNGLTASMRGLPFGSSQAYTVRAGRALPSGTKYSQPSPLLAAPVGPATPYVRVSGGGSTDTMTVSWSDEHGDPVAGATSFTVQRASAGGSWQTVATGLPASTSSWSEVIGTPATQYTYRVIANSATVSLGTTVGALATGVWTTSASGTDYGLTRPAAPAGLTAFKTAPTTVQVAWRFPGAAFDYVVTETKDGGAPTTLAVHPSNFEGSELSFARSGLSAGSTYTWAVTASNVNGSKGGVSPASTTSAVIAPSAPTIKLTVPKHDVSVPAKTRIEGGNEVDITFTLVPGATQYSLYHAGTATPIKVFGATGAGSSPVVIKSSSGGMGGNPLLADAAESFSVVASNAGGNSSAAAGSATAYSTYEQVIEADAPISYWRLGLADPGVYARDEMGHHTGLYTRNFDTSSPLRSAPHYNSRSETGAAAIAFDADTAFDVLSTKAPGSNNAGSQKLHVIVPQTGDAMSDTTTVSLEAWVDTPVLSAGSTMGVFLKQGYCLTATEHCWGWALGYGNMTKDQCIGYAQNLGNDVMFAGPFCWQAKLNQKLNVWHHVVLVASGNTVWKGYVDGVPVASSAWDSSQLTKCKTAAGTYISCSMNAGYPAKRYLTIGGYDFMPDDSNHNNRWFTGVIDEVAVYNGVLSDAQVKAHYLAGQCRIEGAAGSNC